MAKGSTIAESYDLVVLGSGSTAFAAAIRAAELGKTAVMTESRTLGGTCVNRGRPDLLGGASAPVPWSRVQRHGPGFPGAHPPEGCSDPRLSEQEVSVHCPRFRPDQSPHGPRGVHA